MTVHGLEKEVVLIGDAPNFPSATTSISALVLCKLRI